MGVYSKRMLGLFRRLFIKDYEDINNPIVRQKHGLMASIFGIITNFIIVALKVSIAFILFAQSNYTIFSIALLADALNNLSDMASSLVMLISFKVANKPADADHPFGHHRSEYIGGLIVAIIVVVLAAMLLENSIENIIASTTVSYDLLAIIILGVTILLKFFQGYFNLAMSKLLDSKGLKATAYDSFFDSLATILVLISGLLSYTLDINYLDPYMGLGVSLFVLYGGIKMVLETLSPLLGEAASKEEVMKIEEAIKKNPLILGVHDLIIHDYGPGRRYIVLHIEVNAELSLLEAHKVADETEKLLKEEFLLEATVHIDPKITNDPSIQLYDEKVTSLLKAIDPSISYHDLSITDELVQIEVLISYELANKENEIETKLKDLFTPKHVHVYFDHPYEQ